MQLDMLQQQKTCLTSSYFYRLACQCLKRVIKVTRYLVLYLRRKPKCTLPVLSSNFWWTTNLETLTIRSVRFTVKFSHNAPTCKVSIAKRTHSLRRSSVCRRSWTCIALIQTYSIEPVKHWMQTWTKQSLRRITVSTTAIAELLTSSVRTVLKGRITRNKDSLNSGCSRTQWAKCHFSWKPWVCVTSW